MMQSLQEDLIRVTPVRMTGNVNHSADQKVNSVKEEETIPLLLPKAGKESSAMTEEIPDQAMEKENGTANRIMSFMAIAENQAVAEEGLQKNLSALLQKKMTELPA